LRHGGGVTEVLAGYGHAAYEQGEFGRAPAIDDNNGHIFVYRLE
jgi:hypothetical protein